VSRSREARLWELPEFFRRSVSVEKVCWACFSSRKRSASRATREEGRKAQEPRAQARRVEDLNRPAPRDLAREWALATLSRRRYSCARETSAGGGSKPGDGQALGTGVELGEPGCDLGERGRKTVGKEVDVPGAGVGGGSIQIQKHFSQVLIGSGKSLRSGAIASI
jgi:hypothetical protein